MDHLVGHTHDNIPVFVDLINSGAAKHISQQPHLLTLVAEALQRVTLDGVTITTKLEQDMGRSIGYDQVVETSETDAVFYAQLVKDNTYTRFVKNGKPLSTRHLAMILDYSKDNSCYNLNGVWLGHLRPPRPGTPEETARGNQYWRNHAFIFDSQALQLRTMTKTCPY